MKKMFKKWRSLLFISMIAVPTILMGQTTDPTDPGGGGGAPPGETYDAPFDGGVSLLVAAGIAYGLKKRHDKKKTEKEKL